MSDQETTRGFHGNRISNTPPKGMLTGMIRTALEEVWD